MPNWKLFAIPTCSEGAPELIRGPVIEKGQLKGSWQQAVIREDVLKENPIGPWPVYLADLPKAPMWAIIQRPDLASK